MHPLYTHIYKNITEYLGLSLNFWKFRVLYALTFMYHGNLIGVLGYGYESGYYLNWNVELLDGLWIWLEMLWIQWLITNNENLQRSTVSVY